MHLEIRLLLAKILEDFRSLPEAKVGAEGMTVPCANSRLSFS